MRVLSEAQVRQLLDPVALISALESAFRDRYPKVIVPVRVHMELREGVFLIMPCYDQVGNTLGMKFVRVQRNPVHPEDRIQATFMLLDPDTGQPRLVMRANYLTDLRTAATSALATRFLAAQGTKTLGVFGCGRQARAHLKVLPIVRKFERALVCGQDSARTRAFCEEMSRELGFPVEPADATACAANSDVLCTCTTARSPLFDGKLLRPGTHLNLVGAFQPHAREVDSLTVTRGAVVVEGYEAALAEAGDILMPMEEGVIGGDHIQMDLHELLNGKQFDSDCPREITIFKSVGCGLEDLVAAELIERNLVPE